MDDDKNYLGAIQDFHAARSQAGRKELLARLTGASTHLLSYDEVREKLKLAGSADRGLKDIPINAIVGSVGRYEDFTRDFLPRHPVNQERWARVKLATTDLTGLPPIEVYKVGDAYFVKDGHHRVSVARQLGAEYIQAYVIEIRTRVPVTPDTRPEDLILKAEYADFLERTRLDELRPEADFTVTELGRYEVLEEHIRVHRYYMGIDFQRDISYEEAVKHWYDTVYLPVIRIIRELDLLDAFPNRTETDLYLWLAEHRAALEKEIGWQVSPAAAATDLSSHRLAGPLQIVTRLSSRIVDAISLDTLEAGPPTGQWRRERLAMERNEYLFNDILVPVNGEENGWNALDQAILIAQREHSRLHGLHVVGSNRQAKSKATLSVKAAFEQRCAQAGVRGELTIAAGDVVRQICSRAYWTDLVITNLAYPPSAKPLARLSSGFRELVQRCPRPLLATPSTSTPLQRALLAYDGSPKAEEALYVSTYLAGQWQIPIVVVSIIEQNQVTSETLDHARLYLEAHGITATYVLEQGDTAERILKAREDHACDLIVMGGYGYNPVLEVVLGSVVDQVLRESGQPMLICR